MTISDCTVNSSVVDTHTNTTTCNLGLLTLITTLLSSPSSGMRSLVNWSHCCLICDATEAMNCDAGRSRSSHSCSANCSGVINASEGRKYSQCIT